MFEGISNGVRERGAEGERGWGRLVGDPQDNAGIKDVVKLMLMMFLFRLLGSFKHAINHIIICLINLSIKSFFAQNLD